MQSSNVVDIVVVLAVVAVRYSVHFSVHVAGLLVWDLLVCGVCGVSLNKKHITLFKLPLYFKIMLLFIVKTRITHVIVQPATAVERCRTSGDFYRLWSSQCHFLPVFCHGLHWCHTIL